MDIITASEAKKNRINKYLTTEILQMINETITQKSLRGVGQCIFDMSCKDELEIISEYLNTLGYRLQQPNNKTIIVHWD